MTSSSSESNAAAPVSQPLRIWVFHCPFNKRNVPVVGTFGSKVEPVVIMTMATWKQLCVQVPQLQSTQFEVGSYDE